MTFSKWRDEEIEVLFKKVLQDDLEKANVQPPPGGFEEVVRKAEIIRGRRRIKALVRKFVVACLIFLLVGSGIYQLFPQQISAAGRRVLHSISLMLGDNLQIKDNQQENGAKFQTLETDTTLLNAMSQAPFGIKIPRYVPPGFLITGVNTLEKDGGVFMLTLVYESPQSSLVIKQANSKSLGGSLTTHQGVEDYTEVDISGMSAVFSNHSDGNVFLLFTDETNVTFTLIGDLSLEDILEIARSL